MEIKLRDRNSVGTSHSYKPKPKKMDKKLVARSYSKSNRCKEIRRWFSLRYKNESGAQMKGSHQ